MLLDCTYVYSLNDGVIIAASIMITARGISESCLSVFEISIKILHLMLSNFVASFPPAFEESDIFIGLHRHGSSNTWLQERLLLQEGMHITILRHKGCKQSKMNVRSVN